MTGARLTRKALKFSPADEPIRILGGSPISVAVPPMLEAKISANRNGNAGRSSSSAITSVTGATSKTVLTLLSSADSIAVVTCSSARMPAGLAFARCADQIARNWNMPERRAIDTMIMMPVRSPIVSQLIPATASF